MRADFLINSLREFDIARDLGVKKKTRSTQVTIINAEGGRRNSINKKERTQMSVLLSGGEESRTPVQTYSPKAFYMLILFCVFREVTGNKQPITSLAAWS